MTLEQLLAQIRSNIAAKLVERNKLATELRELHLADSDDEARITELREAKAERDAEVDALQVRLATLEAEKAGDAAAERLASDVTPTEVRTPKYDEVARVGAEARTYSKESDPRGEMFLRDVLGAFNGRHESNERLARHTSEEMVERAEVHERAVGTGAFSGQIVPQYLTDMYALPARAGREFADVCNQHPLPSQGMNVYIGKGTTGTSAADQANEGDLLSETDYDDTLLTVPVRTAGGSVSISRQASERGAFTEDILFQDMFEAYATNLDNQLINRATVGLSAVASVIAYTDASPTVPEMYPKLAASAAAIEASLLKKGRPDIAVMNSRRWYWMLSQLGSTWPMISASTVPVQASGVNLDKAYGTGARGVLPTGQTIIVDNNVITNGGAGTNEDEIIFAASKECHLWEDPNAPMYIRAEQGQVKKLLIDLVVYGYYAFTAQRYAGVAAKVAGTGLVTPTF